MLDEYRADFAGGGQLLRSLGPLVMGAANQVAAQVRAQQPGADVVVESFTTDRASAMVMIRDPRARLWAVRDGIFTRATSSAGLTLRDQ